MKNVIMQVDTGKGIKLIISDSFDYFDFKPIYSLLQQ